MGKVKDYVFDKLEKITPGSYVSSPLAVVGTGLLVNAGYELYMGNIDRAISSVIIGSGFITSSRFIANLMNQGLCNTAELEWKPTKDAELVSKLFEYPAKFLAKSLIKNYKKDELEYDEIKYE